MPAFQPLKRKFDQVGEENTPRNHVLQATDNQTEKYWSAQWRRFQTKKHKTWEGDAVLAIMGTRIKVYDTEGRSIGGGALPSPACEGLFFSTDGRDFELEREIPRQEFLSGQCFGRTTTNPPSTTTSNAVKSAPAKQFVVPKMKKKPSIVSPMVPETVMPSDSDPTIGLQEALQVTETHWSANWRKYQQSGKQDLWTGDAYVSHVGDKLVVVTEEGKPMGHAAWKNDRLHPGYKFGIGGKQFQLLSQVLPSQLPTASATELMEVTRATDPVRDTLPARKFLPLAASDNSVKMKQHTEPLHDPNSDSAVVMKSPTPDHNKRFNPKGFPIRPVVVDPILARHLRPHQIEGVKFLYECVMGLRKHEGHGCILADEMGLGKTLQTISLIWTLLKQNPYAGGRPVVENILIVCPVSLVENWKNEFHKWLGRDRVGISVYKDKNSILTFMAAKKEQVLILGYERLRTVIKDLAACVPPIGLIVCDEGHRLKSANGKTASTFNALRTTRRVILSGTPIQNDLGEFHAMANFVNPGLLDDYSTFRRVYEAPILRSRAPGSTSKEKEIGEMRSAQLMNVAKSFVLRREAHILGNYLPPKHEYVVFVTPTSLQLAIFRKLLQPDKIDDLEQKSTAESLAMINLLTKVTSSPVLLKTTLEKHQAAGQSAHRPVVNEAVKLLPERIDIADISLSGKMIAITNLLREIRDNTEEKCVLVSHYTSTLNILEAHCKKAGYSYFRLDGSTPAPKRQEYVNVFNKCSQSSGYIFLLSSKAGGVGINLIGASRLCLVDSDWNPSHDLQAMARCHRDGQKRPVYIYRFLTAGTIDEKIYQRQITKIGLSDSLMGTSATSNSKSDSFTRKDLRAIFCIDPDTACNTHDLLECRCTLPKGMLPIEEDLQSPDRHGDHQGFMAASSIDPTKVANSAEKRLKTKEDLAALGEWKHINCLDPTGWNDIQDTSLRHLFHSSAFPDSMSDDGSTEPDLHEGEDRILSVRDGGTVCFLFEKSSVSTA